MAADCAWGPVLYIGVSVGGTDHVAITRTSRKTARLHWEPTQAADGLLGKCGISSWGTEGLRPVQGPGKHRFFMGTARPAWPGS